MDERVRRILEYDKIAGQIALHAISAPGNGRCLALEPQGDAARSRRVMELTICADEAWTHIGGNPMQPFEDCSVFVERCTAGGISSPAELLLCANTLRAIRLVKSGLTNEAKGSLLTLVEALTPFPQVESEIFRCILSQEEIADDASAELRGIRRQIRLASERVRQKLNEIMTSSTMRTKLQDNIITMRNGRYVVPIKAEQAGSVDGLEHDRSASGATVFIEPLAVLRANNELREYQAAERNEIQRILQRLGGLIGAHTDSLNVSIDVMGELDLIFAKVGWGRAQKAVCPQLTSGGTMKVMGARHPLIAKDQVVPIDLVCGGETRALIITGPNTGGKTVTLKTAGLFILLAQSGVYLPCEKAVMPHYDALYADIGDEQSIEQSLSTFSSHMVNLVDIIQNAKHGTMVLADELGVGTDPVEGAALAIALLQTLTKQGANVIATTHYSELKAFAMSEPGFVNAGMEFDMTTLRPTFRLMIGSAGSSNAFEISRRLGLPNDVIELAKQQVSLEAMRLERAIAAAEALRVLAQKQMQEALNRGQEERLALQSELNELRKRAQKDEKHAGEALEKARRTLERARNEASEAVELARQAAAVQNKREREQLLQSARTSLKEIQRLQGDLEEEEQQEDGLQTPSSIEVGQTVYVLSIRADATVLSQPDGRGEVQVQAGIVKLLVPANQLRVAKASKDNSSARVQRQDMSVPMDIDVRGMTVDEASMAIDMHLDAAVLSGLEWTNIIHGKGTGALRIGVRAFLQKHPHVKGMRSGGYGEGGDGVTVVELR